MEANSFGKEFEPITVTYAIGGGTLVPGLKVSVRFRYFLFEMNNGFGPAIAHTALPIQGFVKDDVLGIPASPPTVTNLADVNGNLVKVEFRHPNFKPFGADVPLMFIQTQPLDEPIADEVLLTVELLVPEEHEVGNSAKDAMIAEGGPGNG